MNAAAEHKGPMVLSENADGFRVEVHDESGPYAYSNLFRVLLRVVARLPGGKEPYETVLERTGIQAADLERVKGDMVANFKASALPYLLHPDFPARLARHRDREGRKVIRFPEAP